VFKADFSIDMLFYRPQALTRSIAEPDAQGRTARSWNKRPWRAHAPAGAGALTPGTKKRGPTGAVADTLISSPSRRRRKLDGFHEGGAAVAPRTPVLRKGAAIRYRPSLYSIHFFMQRNHGQNAIFARVPAKVGDGTTKQKRSDDVGKPRISFA
jgi:hypothetical protein